MSLTSYTKLGASLAAITFAIDQGHKWWMLGPFNIAERQPVRVAPFLDLVLAWNRGVSYGWFATSSQTGRWILVAVMASIVAVLAAWLVRATDRLTAVSLGLLIGGALGNMLDRILHGAVADFFFFHVGSFQWYIFNLADVAIVAGVAGLLYSSWKIGGHSGEASAAE
ncbi:MAG: signal peptidase II [Pseudomonadota bacterium]